MAKKWHGVDPDATKRYSADPALNKAIRGSLKAGGRGVAGTQTIPLTDAQIEQIVRNAKTEYYGGCMGSNCPDSGEVYATEFGS